MVVLESEFVDFLYVYFSSIGISIHRHGSRARGLTTGRGGGVAGGVKNGSVNFVLKIAYLRKNTILSDFSIFYFFLKFSIF